MRYKILLINLKTPVLAGQKKTFMPPIHLWKIRATLRKMSDISEVDICDEHIGERCEDYFDKKKYMIAGISCRFSIQHNEMLRVAEVAKSYGSLVIAGGIHAAVVGLYEELKNITSVTRIRGEEYFPELLNGKIEDDINAYDIPFFKHGEIEKYWQLDKPHDLQSKTKKWMSVYTSVGCDRECGFCGVKRFCGHWQPYTIEYMKNYFDYLRDMGIQELFLEDDNITRDKKRFIELVKIMNQYGFRWSCPNGIFVKSLFDNRVFKSLVGSGCWRLSLPFETGSEHTARLMRLGNKWMPLVSAQYIVNRLKKIGIKTCGFFIIGYPGETEQDVKKTLDYANRLDLDQRNIYIATPYPGTQLYEECIEKEYIKKTDNFYEQLVYKNAVINTPWLSAEKVMQMKAEDRKKALDKTK